MAFTQLTTVSETESEGAKGAVVELGPRGPDSASWRMRQLQHEARSLAREQLESFARDLSALAARATEIAGGGEHYPVGARDIASRLAAELPPKSQLLLTLLSRDG